MTALTAGCPSGLSPTEVGVLTQDPSAFVTDAGGVKTLDILVRGARCGGCLSKIETGLNKLPGVRSTRLNLSTGKLRIEWIGPLAARRIIETLAKLGYGATAFDPGQVDAAHLREERSLLIALAVAGFAAGNVMLLSVSVWAGQDMPVETRTLLHWISALIATPAAAWAGRPFFRSAIASVKARRLNMDVPISLAVILALSMSLFETIRGGEYAYFDASVTLLFFLLIGRFLDARLRRRAYSAANALAALTTATATRLSAGGIAEAVRAVDVRPGDRLLVAAGERLAVDAELVSGVSEMDVRLVTGEVDPVATFPGQGLHAGAVNLVAPVIVRAVAAADRSLMADVARMLEAGEQKKSSYRRIADRAAEAYVPRVHALALLGFMGWLAAGAALPQAVFIAVTVLIITCPCAMALAAPLVQVVAAARLYREGAYLSSGDALERIAGVDHVVFDKTGTLTLGDPVLLPGEASDHEIEMAAQLARASRHPFSRALAKHAGVGLVAHEVQEVPGQGVSGIVNGRLARLGAASFVSGSTGANSELWFAFDGEQPVVFRFEDRIRPDARLAIDQLRAMGISAEILSGDSEGRVTHAAGVCGVTQWIAGATPQSKAARLEMLQRDGCKVLMVGDGLNDAGALAGAHASIAPGGAVDVSRLASDCVFSGDSLQAVVRIIDISRKARIHMRQNFAFAAFYNVLAVPVALAGFATPMVAAIAMSGSSVVVTLNALRLAGGKDRVPAGRP